MSSRLGEVGSLTGFVGVQVVEDGSCDASFEAAQGFGGGLALGFLLLVIGPAGPLSLIWVTVMRWIAVLSCRLPDLVSRTRPVVLPDQTGIGAIPAWRAKAASDLNRATPEVSPTILAAVRAPTLGMASRAGAAWAASALIRLSRFRPAGSSR